ncbi:caveolin-1-like [Acanthaster planci]|uniref:Caveolin n=1 Tax=Acanthaster planci TaxID=133434 RepID=A0A8B7Z9T2_ACAPL|nr:caveolin-1-like [Acanthaster planci]
MNAQTVGPAPVMNPEPYNAQAPVYHQASLPTVVGQPFEHQPVVEPKTRREISFFAEEDLYLMSPPVKVEYTDIFKEADGANSFDKLAEISGFVFKWTQLGIYRFFSIILGIVLVFFWGIIFALINFITVYTIQPAIKLYFVCLRPGALLYRAVVRSYLDPLWQSIGLVFSRVNGRFTFNLKGLQNQKTAQAAIEEV